MKISKIYSDAKSPVFSFEIFPPKTPEGDIKLINTVADLKKLNPSFISVTYGAGGSTKEKTIDLCETIQNQFQITTMCHFTCVGASSSEIRDTLKVIESKKIENVIALRGDPPKGQGIFTKHPQGFGSGKELIEFIRNEKFTFCLAGGCYPEKHPDAPTLEDDIKFLKQKVDAGAEFLITQLFFSNTLFQSFLSKARSAGINVPIIPGIMPITTLSQINRFKEMADCEIPQKLIDDLQNVKDDPTEFLKRSIQFTVEQCRELLKMGVAGIHFYTLNQSTATIEIMKSLL
ncbi:MAG TPA: methylenetetrahydrofolate reductase [NAD(P)H] [Leptospiraceae bacterium]|nr:methylenetetrahydrofolate reductase [NAD(P)H] [Leptospiraceae bacterium]HMW03826.1 methylenetetrahydrofolate reductase [NAD(P)H] [Leptospiraceae bacterium]HMX33066.1 methylenetetrahydrofolate reductase [NAD(P)H] [Leptospiraceae bacterium]HMY29806.1 methylenetetrahydrofolate reductase [NAD(P)H] [Leptospiraceae bacterium]HMZ67425.1 methylenetetrahydrofolate reductase [NAD(P)H] [Leptospiraceae bacterium]